MKIKHSFFISLMPQLLVFLAATVVCSALRCVQMFKFIDHETGFLTGGEYLSYILYAVILLSFVFFTVTYYLSAASKKIDTYIHNVKNSVTGVFTLIFALSLFYDFVNSLSLSVTALNDTPAYSGVKGLMSSGFLPVTLQSFFALFSAIYFIIICIDYFKGRNASSRFRILALFPVAWAAMRLIYRFVRQISFVQISDLFLELVMLAMMIITFMAFAQVKSGVYSDGFAWRIPGFGLSCAVIAASLNIARLIYLFVGNGSINPAYTFNFTDLAFSLFILGLALNIRKQLILENAD